MTVIKHEGVLHTKKRNPRDAIHRIVVHVADMNQQSATAEAHCGAKLFGGGVMPEYCGPTVNPVDVARVKNATEGDAGLWVYYKECAACVDEQLNRLGKEYWKKKPIRDLQDIDL
jgi:hypothetical protein